MTDTSVDVEHGDALTERVIGAVRADPRQPIGDAPGSSSSQWGTWLDGDPEPMPADVLAELTFPSGRPLPPSLRRWLAFDTSLLARFGWLARTGDGYALTPRTIHQLATDTVGEGWGQCFEPLAARFPECFHLPGGGDSRRVLVVGDADEYGEYPVLALDVDDLPCLELMYPGFDVYLAHTAGLIKRLGGSGYSALTGHRTYGRRMATHARQLLDGQTALTFPF